MTRRICDASAPQPFDLAACCAPLLPDTQLSPVETFVARRTAAIQHVNTVPGGFNLVEWSGMLFIRVMADMETYLRDMFARAVELDSELRVRIGGEKVPFSSMYYYSTEQVGRSLWDRLPLSQAGYILDLVKKITGHKVDDNAALKVAVDDAQVAFEVRHALIHSHGVLKGSAWSEITGEVVAGARVVELDRPDFVSLVSLVSNVVIECNQYLFERIFDAWYKRGKLSGHWGDDEALFRTLLRLFAQDAAIHRVQRKRIYQAHVDRQ